MHIQKKLLDNAIDVYKGLSLIYPEIRRPEFDALVTHPNQAFLDIYKALEESLQTNFYLKIEQAEITDLQRAFEEGFEGYSVSIRLGDCCFETGVSDIQGNSAEWNKLFKL